MPGGTVRTFCSSGHGSMLFRDVTLGFILCWERCCCKRHALLASDVSSGNARVIPNMPVMHTCIFTLVKLNESGTSTDLFQIYRKWIGQNIHGIIETPL